MSQPDRLLLYFLAASFGLSLIPGGKYAIYPFRLFATWLHECCHALAASLVGGDVTKITLAPDTSGLTVYRLPASRLRHAIVASAGYPGTAAAGCLLYWISRSGPPSHSRLALLALGALAALTVLFWVRGLFGILVVGSIGVALVALERAVAPDQAATILGFLAVQTGLQAIFDVRTLFGLDPGARSDAQTMRSLFWLPAWFWAVAWLGFSLLLSYRTVQP